MKTEKQLHDEALAEGYKDETCGECHQFFAAHIHFIRCNVESCPMKDGQGSLLERLLTGSGGNENN